VIDDLIIKQPEPLKFIPVIKDAEACMHCGGIKPELYWNGRALVHGMCEHDARAAKRLNGKAPKRVTPEEFMQRLAENPKLVRRLFK